MPDEDIRIVLVDDVLTSGATTDACARTLLRARAGQGARLIAPVVIVLLCVKGGAWAGYLLQKAGLIQYARGHITVMDRPGLMKRTCECYEVVKKEYDRLLPDLEAT